MDDEAESSHAGRHDSNTVADADSGGATAAITDEEETRQCQQSVKDRRLDAKRKRVHFLEQLLRDLDMAVFLEFILIYHLDCSFFWFFLRSILHVSTLTPVPDIGLAHQRDEHKPFLPLILFTFVINFLLHLLYPAPAAGEDTRGYLHGGLIIDFIGQQGPTPKWKLFGLDIAVLLLQIVMVSIHVKRRNVKKKLANNSSSASTATRNTEGGSTSTGGQGAASVTNDVENQNAAREQDADAEERGVLRRTDTLSDIGADPEEEDTLLSSSDTGHVDALELLASGQCVIGEFFLIETLLQEHHEYNAYRETRTSENRSNMGLSPDTLNRLHSIRVRFGVGGG